MGKALEIKAFKHDQARLKKEDLTTPTDRMKKLIVSLFLFLAISKIAFSNSNVTNCFLNKHFDYFICNSILKFYFEDNKIYNYKLDFRKSTRDSIPLKMLYKNYSWNKFYSMYDSAKSNRYEDVIDFSKESLQSKFNKKWWKKKTKIILFEQPAFFEHANEYRLYKIYAGEYNLDILFKLENDKIVRFAFVSAME